MKKVIAVSGKAKNVFRYISVLARNNGKKTLKDLS
jgi:hypothetical protein